jgi:hypothetical protein
MRWRRRRAKRTSIDLHEKKLAKSIITDLELETNFACKVAYLKLRHEMTKMEQDQLYFDTNFDQHMKMYAKFKEQVVNSIVVKRGLSLS